jgi:hypothetical protein
MVTMKKYSLKSLSVFVFIFVFIGNVLNASGIDDIPNNFRFSQISYTMFWGSSKNKKSDIKNLQIVLNYDPKTKARLEPDGVFGKLTYYAVEKFQRKHYLYVDGKVGPQTKAELDKVLDELKNKNSSLTKVSLVSPGNKNNSGTKEVEKRPLLKWYSNPDATYYLLELKDLIYGNLVLNDKKIIVNSSSLYSSYQVHSDLIAGHKYRWKVKACNSVECSEWSDSYHFEIKMLTPENWKSIKPIPISPGNRNKNYVEISTTQPTFRWEMIKGVPRYEVTIKYANNIPVVLNSYSDQGESLLCIIVNKNVFRSTSFLKLLS